MKRAFFAILFSSYFSLVGSALASSESPEGLWKSYDDKNKPTGFVRISEQAGVYIGVIEKGLPEDKEDKICTACQDERKNQKLVGMTIIKNVRAKGDVYEGTEILDPFSGDTYRVKLRLIKNNKMEVRGFIGLSLFGRTQTWERVENGQ
jgi:uncharacterized protein (DUF2147 family)